MLNTYIIRKGDTVRLDNCCRALKALCERQDTEINLWKYQPKRTDSQHRKFWAACRQIAAELREAGVQCSEDDVHDAVLGEIYGWSESPWGSKRPAESLTRPRKKSKMDMIEILERQAVWAAEHGVVLGD